MFKLQFSLGSSHIGEEIGIAVLEVALGIFSGLVLGLLISYLPHIKMKYKVMNEFLVIVIYIFYSCCVDLEFLSWIFAVVNWHVYGFRH